MSIFKSWRPVCDTKATHTKKTFKTRRTTTVRTCKTQQINSNYPSQNEGFFVQKFLLPLALYANRTHSKTNT